MNVAELIAELKKYPQNMVVIFPLHSEYCMLDAQDLHRQIACWPRDDGWVANQRPDKPSKEYLCIGN